jgi:hypothetical protein
MTSKIKPTRSFWHGLTGPRRACCPGEACQSGQAYRPGQAWPGLLACWPVGLARPGLSAWQGWLGPANLVRGSYAIMDRGPGPGCCSSAWSPAARLPCPRCPGRPQPATPGPPARSGKSDALTHFCPFLSTSPPQELERLCLLGSVPF